MKRNANVASFSKDARPSIKLRLDSFAVPRRFSPLRQLFLILLIPAGCLLWYNKHSLPGYYHYGGTPELRILRMPDEMTVRFDNPQVAPHIKQVATLVTELYELLEEMHYIKPGSIAYPPHISPSINRSLAIELGLNAPSIELLERLPYVKSTPGPDRSFDNSEIAMQATNWRAYGYYNILLLTASFADFRDDAVLRASRDTWCADQENYREIKRQDPREGCEPENRDRRIYLDADLLSLTVPQRVEQRTAQRIPETGSLILDLTSNRLYTIGWGSVLHRGSVSGETRGSIDPTTRGLLAPEIDTLSRGPDIRGDPRTYAWRPADEALRDYIKRFRALDWIPGFQQENNDTAMARDAYRSLYKQHGWPLNFNGKAFEKARKSWVKYQKKRWTAAKPVQKLKDLQRELEWDKIEIENIKKFRSSYHLSLEKEEETADTLAAGATFDYLQVAEKRIKEKEHLIENQRKFVAGVNPEVRRETEDIIEQYGQDFALDITWYSEHWHN